MISYLTIAELTRHWKATLTPKLAQGHIVVVKDGRSDECLFEIHPYQKKRYPPVKTYAPPLALNVDCSDEVLLESLRGECH